ncbi:SMI1/KNR4 family protein [Neorhizobium galegae]|uniref:Putative glucan synthasis protein n=1 Tax=Neorhizobium galegae bv. officinalis TaxID=323656 RepID=A0A0T7GR30_NEOGA|nr:SMI1/KNR4 family protein [Neorhizobium galegae]CDZ49647.1 Putative glucan synthasis protein [Neorhizobium galegae bv. officinalis]
MSLSDYRFAIENLRENGIDILGTKSATENDLKQISYKKMLSEYGALEFDTIEIYGWLSQGIDAKFITNVVHATERERADGRISDTMIPFLTAGYGPFYVMDCAEMNADGEAPVYEVSAGGYTKGKDKLADSFGEFLRNEVRRTLEARAQGGSEFDDDDDDEDSPPSREFISEYWKDRARDFE